MYILKILKSFGCDLDGAMRETCKHFSSAKRKHREKKKLIVGSKEEKYTSTSWAVPREFWLRPKHWKQGEEGRALWSNRVGSIVRGFLTFCEKYDFIKWGFQGFLCASMHNLSLRQICFQIDTATSDVFLLEPLLLKELIASVPLGHYRANKLDFSHGVV